MLKKNLEWENMFAWNKSVFKRQPKKIETWIQILIQFFSFSYVDG